MLPQRLVREVEKRLGATPGVTPELRAEILDAIREEIARERRRVDPTATVEAERERRLEEETLREVVEAINRAGSLEDTLGELMKQLSRLVDFDSCSVALSEPEGSFRIVAARDFAEGERVLGARFKDELSDAIRENPQTLSVPDVQAEPRFVKMEGTGAIRSWAGLPLVVEGEVIGIVSLDRRRVEPFDDEDLRQAKAVAFSAAFAIRKVQALEQVRRYAHLMEQTVQVDQLVFAGEPAARVARKVLQSALRIGSHRGGLLVLEGPGGPRITVASAGLETLENTPAPAPLCARQPGRLFCDVVRDVCRLLGTEAPTQEMYLVPVATRDTHVGTLVLFDTNGESPDDRLMEAFASRAATAYLHAARVQG